jgi:hypothetical protein
MDGEQPELRQQQAKTQQAETKLQREVETLRAQQKSEPTVAAQQKPKVEEITATEPVARETSADVMIREQAAAVPGGSFMVEESMATTVKKRKIRLSENRENQTIIAQRNWI